MSISDFNRVAANIPVFGDLLLHLPDSLKSTVNDIHIKTESPVTLCAKAEIFYLNENGSVSRTAKNSPLATADDIHRIFVHICGQSVFSHENEIKHGFVSTDFSCRVGVCGTAVTESDGVKSVRNITSLVFRIPTEVCGCSDRLFKSGINFSQGVLIAGAPSSGKTTFLRDIAEALATGRFFGPSRVAVLDERGELGGCCGLGPCADILRGYPKREAFDIAVRMLSPQFIICDELSPEELSVVEQSVFAGVSLVACVHATREHFLSRPLCRSLLSTGAFGTLVFLHGRAHPGEILSIERTDEIYENPRRNFDNSQWSVLGA